MAPPCSRHASSARSLQPLHNQRNAPEAAHTCTRRSLSPLWLATPTAPLSRPSDRTSLSPLSHLSPISLSPLPHLSLTSPPPLSHPSIAAPPTAPLYCPSDGSSRLRYRRWGVSRCFASVRDHERQKHGRFRFIVRARPDMLPGSHVPRAIEAAVDETATRPHASLHFAPLGPASDGLAILSATASRAYGSIWSAFEGRCNEGFPDDTWRRQVCAAKFRYPAGGTECFVLGHVASREPNTTFVPLHALVYKLLRKKPNRTVPPPPLLKEAGGEQPTAAGGERPTAAGDERPYLALIISGRGGDYFGRGSLAAARLAKHVVAPAEGTHHVASFVCLERIGLLPDAQLRIVRTLQSHVADQFERRRACFMLLCAWEEEQAALQRIIKVSHVLSTRPDAIWYSDLRLSAAFPQDAIAVRARIARSPPEAPLSFDVGHASFNGYTVTSTLEHCSCGASAANASERTVTEIAAWCRSHLPHQDWVRQHYYREPCPVRCAYIDDQLAAMPRRLADFYFTIGSHSPTALANRSRSTPAVASLMPAVATAATTHSAPQLKWTLSPQCDRCLPPRRAFTEALFTSQLLAVGANIDVQPFHVALLPQPGEVGWKVKTKRQVIQWLTEYYGASPLEDSSPASSERGLPRPARTAALARPTRFLC